MKNQFEGKAMRALSWKQPYASLMLYGKKETRTWSTKYRGLVLICASKAPDSNAQILSISGKTQYSRIAEVISRNSIRLSDTYGHAIAVGELVDCWEMRKSDSDDCFVEAHADLYAHDYRNVVPIKPIPFKGAQGWRTLDKDFISKIQLL